MTEYTPVSCAIHSEYELAIMRRTPTRICWTGESGESRDELLNLTDLNTRSDGEYLSATTVDGENLEIRLDQIL
ncbi:MAG: transcriptional antiterminator, Rof [Gammaproteobacteria bacterium]|uniref:Transcriptional antiterminator, Rof n=1 Tax=Candidatus Thiopontia autotrophica TaxID=2841688 RepID=A0A8J6P757_9GAMM|nr:transcriptional antiterminator, Rof [Candidatus Thiopontia autotrophica]